MPFTLFKFPTLFGRKHSSYKLGKSELVRTPLDLDNSLDPVIITHQKPLFTTFGYNSEYALDNILKNSVYDYPTEDDFLPKIKKKRHAKKRPSLRNYYNARDRCEQSLSFDLDDNEHYNMENNKANIVEKEEKVNEIEDVAAYSREHGDGKEDDDLTFSNEKFQKLYEELQTCSSGLFQTDFEKIYDELATPIVNSDSFNSSGSYLPSAIYKMHTENHNQSMDFLTQYMASSPTTSIGLEHAATEEATEDEDDEVKDEKAPIFCLSESPILGLNLRLGSMTSRSSLYQTNNTKPYSSIWASHHMQDRLDFIPAKETRVVLQDDDEPVEGKDMQEEEEESGIEMPSFIIRRDGDDGESNVDNEEDDDNDSFIMKDSDEEMSSLIIKQIELDEDISKECEKIIEFDVNIVDRGNVVKDKLAIDFGSDGVKESSDEPSMTQYDVEGNDDARDIGEVEGDDDGRDIGEDTGSEDDARASGVESSCSSQYWTPDHSGGETMPVDDMDSEDDCISLDSGLETSGQTLESESIYENAAVLKSANLVKSVTPTLEKYQFGLNEDFEHFTVADSDVVDGADKVLVTGGERGVTWGVRTSHSPPQPAARTGSPFDRSTNPTEDKIAKEIREMKEREEELKRIRERTIVTPGASGQAEPTSKHANSDKFNPSNYQPQILHPDKKTANMGRPRIMEEFLQSGGKVTPFISPPEPQPVVQLRKPQVHKAVPKVSPPAPSGQRQASGLLVSVQDKIQAEVADSLAREEELRRRRRSTVDTREDTTEDRLEDQDRVDGQGEEEEDVVEQEEIVPDVEPDIQVPADHPSLMHIRGKSALISVWENRIQSAERNA